MTGRVDWLPADTLPDPQDVLHLQGIPAGTVLPSRISAIVDAATAIYLETAEPRAVAADISHEAFDAVFRGEGRNAPDTPIEEVAPRALALTLFVATIGGSVTERIQQLFAQNEPALAAMLDSVASAAADRLTELLAMRDQIEPADAAGSECVTLGYSPGYCGWHVSGQRALFAFLRPGAIGVTLNASCLMDPLKSVSGVLAAGPPEIHGFNPGYPFCADCRDKPCLGRSRPQSRPASAR
jgi:hypothetical protein